MNEQTLEMQIHAKAQEAKSSIDTLVKSLTNIENTLGNICLELNSIEKKSSNSINITTKEINKFKNSTDNANSSANKLGTTLKNVFAYTGVKKLTSQLLGWMDEAVDQTEQMNLFNVVFDNVEKDGKMMFSNLGKEATKFQYKLNEAFGTNKTETLYTQAIYQSMGENQGISDYYSKIMSETMTKFTYDLASLYNKSEKTTAEALRAGVYSGQTKPVRNFGLDITQTSMQPILSDLGIDKQVKELSQAEKMILRYLAVLKQGEVAMGDFANTIESPSNQLKIFKQQLVETKVALSSLFINTFANILPYANAILMVIKEISKAIANMFGIKLSDYNSGIASQEDAFVDLEDSIGGATGKVKELKREVLGFDQIHNINENKDNGSGGGSSVSGGIDQRLLDAIKGYDNGMDSVNMKAQQIKRSIMKWLGFTEHTNEETGETWYTYDGIDKTLKNIWNSFKGLSSTGKILVGLGLVAGTTKLWNAGKKLLTVIGGSGLGKQLKNLISYIKIYTKLSGNFADGIVSGTNAFIRQKIVVKDSLGHINKFQTAIKGTVSVIGGLVATVGGISLLSTSINELASGSGNLMSVIGLVGGAILTVGGALTTVSSLATIFGTTMSTSMAVATGGISLVIGALAGLITYLSTSKEKTNEYEQALKDLETTANDNANMTIGQIDRTKELTNELNYLVSANGQVKKSDEDRVKYILTKVNEAYGTEYKLIDGKIVKNGEEISSNTGLIKSIDDVMKKKRAEAVLNAYQDVYNESLKQQNKILTDAKKINEDVTLSEKEKQKKLMELEKQYQNNKTTIKDYEKLEQDILSGNLEAMEKSMSKFYDSSKKSHDEAFGKMQCTATEIQKDIDKKFNNKKYTMYLKMDTSSAKKSISNLTKEMSGTIGGGLSYFTKAKGGIYSNGTWENIQQYANGGAPSHGSVFVAGERGAEIVGHINGKTEVLNQSQFASALYMAVSSAMSQYGGQASQIDVYVHTDEGTVVDRINQTTKQTGVCPINI